ncbi:hypothetical protein F53441_676 [Fusarium austroafricanum]|uniref:Uncharacterized protein n=1 Tax=Fusarium austroafricanum TaxID=2364996 RepID=A0A8H4KW78_9HYPO|nr:hypothetical protein F53441_676 [Fusarium austroafricanum]
MFAPDVHDRQTTDSFGNPSHNFAPHPRDGAKFPLTDMLPPEQFDCPFHKFDPIRYQNCRHLIMPQMDHVIDHIVKCHLMQSSNPGASDNETITHCEKCRFHFYGPDAQRKLEHHWKSDQCTLERISTTGVMSSAELLQFNNLIHIRHGGYKFLGGGQAPMISDRVPETQQWNIMPLETPPQQTFQAQKHQLVDPVISGRQDENSFNAAWRQEINQQPISVGFSPNEFLTDSLGQGGSSATASHVREESAKMRLMDKDEDSDKDNKGDEFSEDDEDTVDSKDSEDSDDKVGDVIFAKSY